MSEKNRNTIMRTLRESANDPQRFAELVETWNGLFDAQTKKPSKMRLTDVEGLIEDSFAGIASESRSIVLLEHV